MNRKQFLTLACAFIIAVLAGCDSRVEPEVIDPSVLRVLTVAQIKDFPAGTLTAKVILSGVVMSNSETIGPNAFVMQDGNESKDGITIITPSAHNFKMGDKVGVSLNGAVLEKDNGYFRIVVNDMAAISSQGTGSVFSPAQISYKQFTEGNFQSMYVELTGYEVIDEQIGIKGGGDLMFFSKAKDTIVVSTKALDGKDIPSLSGNIRGIATIKEEGYVLVPTASSDLDLTIRRFKVSKYNNAAIVWAEGDSYDTFISEIASSDIDDAISIDGEGTQSANCFVVSKVGTYCFYAKDASGNYPDGIPDGSMIFMTVKKLGGNTVVAWVDLETNRILWSWHIWASTDPISKMVVEKKSDLGTIMMFDRLLGANGVTPGTPSTHGLYYQWGRKDPMIGVSTIGVFQTKEAESESTLGGVATAKSCVNTTVAPDWNFRDGEASETNALAGAANPTTHFTSNYPSQADTEWQEVSNPCPYGYHVPTLMEGELILGVSTKTTYEGLDQTNLGVTNGGIWFPLNGNRAKKAGRMLNLGRHHYSLMNVLESDKACCIQITDSQLVPKYSFNRGNATGIRCVKN